MHDATAAAHGSGDPHHCSALAAAEQPVPAPKRIVVAYGFWIFLLSDIVMFSALFAAYAVLVRADRGRADGARAVQSDERRDRDGCLLLSSFTCGMASIAAEARNQLWYLCRAWR